MKKIFYGVAVLAVLAIAHYFIVFLPKTRIYEMQQKCAQSAQEFMKDQNFPDGESAKYECHFNEKLNKCFVRIESVNMASKAIAHTVVDVLENKDYGACLEIGYKATTCWMTGQKNITSYFAWLDASKKYMSE